MEKPNHKKDGTAKEHVDKTAYWFKPFLQLPCKSRECPECGDYLLSDVAATVDNCGRRFFSCKHQSPKRKPWRAGDWFEWVDPPFLGRAEYVKVMKAQDEHIDELTKALNETRDMVQGVLDKWNAEADFERLCKKQKTGE